MSVYVRQLAWLYATPKEDEHSRIKRLEADGLDPDMPESDGLYLVEYLQELGFTESGGMGESQLSSREILAWSELSGVDLHPWEFDFIRKLSREYLIESHRSTDPEYPAPYTSEDSTEKNRLAVSDKISNMMKAYKLAREGK